MKEFKLAKDVYWVGAVDFNIRSFHHYSTSPRGTTYNAYYIDADKKTLIDTVSHDYFDTLLFQLSKHVEEVKIDYMVCLHLERDHAGSLVEIVEKYKPETIFCSKLGLMSLKGQFNTEGWNIQVVADGETIDLGNKKLTFFETRMLHWPDSMVAYLHEDNILFTNDIFGQNIACTSRCADTADDIGKSILYEEMKNYYGNIILPQSNLVLKALEKIKALNVPIDMLAPDHGLIFRTKEDVQFAFESYEEFATQKFKKLATIAYDSMWGATEKMAHIIGDTLLEEGIPYKVLDVQKNHVADIMNAFMDGSILLLGSSTRNNNPMSNMMALISHIKGLAPKNRYGASFGSYGWSGEAPKMLTKELEDMNFEILAEPLRVQYGLSKEHVEQCKAFAKEIATKIKAIKE